MNVEYAGVLARSLTDIDPWKRMGFTIQGLENYFLRPDAYCFRFAASAGGETAGAVAIRYPWMRGPYVEFLGLIPAFQKMGIGVDIMNWIEEMAVKGCDRNLWVAVSSFNEPAKAFYLRGGFVQVADLDGLVNDDFTELLLRKRLV